MQHLFGQGVGASMAHHDPASNSQAGPAIDGGQPARRRGLGSSGEIASLLLAGRQRRNSSGGSDVAAPSEAHRLPPPDMSHVHEAGDLSSGKFHAGSFPAAGGRSLPTLPLSRLAPAEVGEGSGGAVVHDHVDRAPSAALLSSRRGSMTARDHLDYPGGVGLEDTLHQVGSASARQPVDLRGIGPGIDDDPRFLAATGRRNSASGVPLSAGAAEPARSAPPASDGEPETPYQRFQRFSDGEYEAVLGMSRAAFHALPKWRQLEVRKAKGYF